MLQQQLAAERSRKAQARRRLIPYTALALVVLAALLLYAGQRLYVRSEAAAQQADDAAIAEQEAAAAFAAAQQLRHAQFLRQLERYEKEVETSMAILRLPLWDEQADAALQGLKERAIGYFSAGQYAEAQEHLQRAEQYAAQTEQRHAELLRKTRRAALQAFAEGRAAAAQGALDRALLLQAEDATLRTLQQRVAVLPLVLEGLREAAAARQENRPAKEHAALQKVLAVDAARSELHVRLQEVEAQLRQQQFAAAIADTQQALMAQQLSEAQGHFAQAQSLFPRHEALAPLREKIRSARLEREFHAQTAHGREAAQRDDWAAAARHLRRSAQLKPHDNSALQQEYAARWMLAAAKNLQDYLANPQRLSDGQIATDTTALLRQTEPFRKHSSRLRQLHDELSQLLLQYQSAAEVTVLSDHATHIVLRGAGSIGKTYQHIIRLRPGDYLLEGSRRGYKSKLMPLRIEAGVARATVRIVCDEKI